MCRNGLKCTRPECYFGHRFPALVVSYFKQRHLEWKRNFTAFLTQEFPKPDHNAAFLSVFHPEALKSNALYLEIAKKLREDYRNQTAYVSC
jgi:hypothetical protein